MSRTLLTEFMMQAPYQPATNYWRAIEIEEVIKHGLPSGEGLDLGCGDGHLMAIILGHVGPRQVVGLDVDQRETAMARRRNVYRGVITARADYLPFPDNQFQFVFSNSVLEHIYEIDAVLREVARVLQPGGTFLFTVPSSDFHRCLKGPPARQDRERYLRETDDRCAHLRYWNVGQWLECLQNFEFTLVHQHEYLSLAQIQRWETIAVNTSGLLYRLLGRRKQPIEIQHQMKIRNFRLRLPRLLASLSAKVLDFGVPPAGSVCGCLLVEARKLG